MKEKIAIVDDSEESLFMIRDMLDELGFCTEAFQEVAAAITHIKNSPPDLILMDVLMPGIDGYQACEMIRSDQSLHDVPVIFVSGVHEPFEKVRAFRVGAVDYITKPFHFEEVAARIQNHLRLNQLQRELASHAKDLEIRVDEKVKEAYDAQMATIFALAKLSESRDQDTGQHMERIQEFCGMVARDLMENGQHTDTINEKFIANIKWASALHDIGKVGISDSILCKPGKLSEDEFTVMRTHAEIGARTLEAVHREFPGNQFLQMGIEIARGHHEKWDGTGYPGKLSEEEIPLAARIMSLVDVYDALRSPRCYKEGFSHKRATSIILSEEGKHFDPLMVQSFRRLQNDFERTWDLMSAPKLEKAEN